MRVTPHEWCGVPPFGNPRITVWLSTPRGLSQIPTSFIGSWCQGIHRTPLKTYKIYRALQMLRVHYAILKQHTAPQPTTPTSPPTDKPPQRRSTHQTTSPPVQPAHGLPTQKKQPQPPPQPTKGAVPVAEDRSFRTQQRADTPHPATHPHFPQHSHPPTPQGQSDGSYSRQAVTQVTGTMIDVPPLSRTPPHTR